jgi:hypothetical protein
VLLLEAGGEDLKLNVLVTENWYLPSQPVVFDKSICYHEYDLMFVL